MRRWQFYTWDEIHARTSAPRNSGITESLRATYHGTGGLEQRFDCAAHCDGKRPTTFDLSDFAPLDAPETIPTGGATCELLGGFVARSST